MADEIGRAEECEHIAAIVVEPLVQCAGQMAMYSPEYLRIVKALCERYQIHLIADEIAVGCGRSGKFFACEHAGIQPDLMTMAKAMAGGLPMGALAIGERVTTVHKGAHSSTFGGNPLACAAAVLSR